MQIQERSQENLSKPAGSKPAFSLESQGLCGLGLHYGRQVYRFRWLIIAFWVVVVIVSIPFAAKVGDVLQGGGYSYHNSESTRAENLISEKLNQPAAQLLVVFQSVHTPVNDPSFQKEVNDFMSRARSFTQITQQDTEHAEFFALPLALLVLLVVFGTLVAAATPILLAVVAVPVTLAVIYAIGQHTTMSVFVLNIASIIGLGISIDYSLFIPRP